MDALVKQFIEEYNRYMDWNHEFRERLNLDAFKVNETAAKLIEDYFSDEKLTPEDYDFSTAKVYLYEDTGLYEMQAFNNHDYGVHYIWCRFGRTKEEHLEEAIKNITERMNEMRTDIAAQLASVQADYDALTNLSQLIHK